MKANVLHIINSFEQGGTERQAVQLVRLLHEDTRYRMHLATLSNRGILRGEAERIGLGEIPEYSLNSFYDRNFLKQIRRCVRFLKKPRDRRRPHSRFLYEHFRNDGGATGGRAGENRIQA